MDVWVGGAGVKVGERGGVGVRVFEACVTITMVDVAVKFNEGGGILKGVAVTSAGVMDGTGDWTGKG